jgi:hypothetical protein
MRKVAADSTVCTQSMSLQDELEERFTCTVDGIYVSGAGGYWSNLTLEENKRLIEALRTKSPREALIEHQPWLEDIIYSPKRPAGLELLQLTGEEKCIDYGCMWGALTIPLAQRTRFVLGVDQTADSLVFLQARLKESGCSNAALLNHDIRFMPLLSNKVDIAVVNGVLEWIPEQGAIELKTYYARRQKKKYAGNPREHQKSFLRRVCENLTERGILYLAIENRYDLNAFFGAEDPHTGLLFTPFAPRALANLLSKVQLGRPYVNWLYSFKGLSRLLTESGFSAVDLYMCFPNYRYPERIIPFDRSLRDFRPTISRTNARGEQSLKRQLARVGEYLAFRWLGLKWFAPSIIAIAHK